MNGRLKAEELAFALKAFGLCPTLKLIDETVLALGISLPLVFGAFERLLHAMEQQVSCPRCPEVVPHARRGMTLEAGLWVSTGAVTGVHPVKPGDHVVASFDGRLTAECTIKAR